MKCQICEKEFETGVDEWVCPECEAKNKYNKWVSIDTLPETIPDNIFFITLSGDEPAIAIFRDGKFYFSVIDNCKYPIQNVTRWMIVQLPDFNIKEERDEI